ncbi:MAG: homogentisate 1,2-dioxygenase [Pirellulaceae bacterium]|nr:homogentisate 1,2-dioxygenase [Pirellulaceae bacterium]
MPSYRRLGKLPPKRHIILPNGENSFLNEGLYYEHIITTHGFDRAYSILYHLRPPTRVLETASAGQIPIEAADDRELRHHHFKTQDLPRGGQPVTGRVPMLFNDDLVAWRCKPDQPQEELFRNGAADEVIFIQQGSGYLETLYGKVPYRRGDYVVVPRSTTYRIVSDDIQKEDHLILECFAPVRVPDRYHNPDGQIYLGAPLYERDFHSPEELCLIDREEPTSILIKVHQNLTRVTMTHHPFDVVGWDGFLYPYTFNAWDFEPLTGTVHLPPPFQQTFECRGFVICTFAPRHLDHHPQAVKVPYVHSNVEADEVLFYVDGEFGSRRGVDLGSMTLHPGGIPHGPHPGTIMKSMEMDRTNEMAVMFDTDRRLHPTVQAMQVDDPSYPKSWL